MSLFYACALSSEWGLLGALRSECHPRHSFTSFFSTVEVPVVLLIVGSDGLHCQRRRFLHTGFVVDAVVVVDDVVQAVAFALLEDISEHSVMVINGALHRFAMLLAE